MLWNKEIKTKKRFVLIYGCLIIFLFILLGSCAEKKETDNNKNNYSDTANEISKEQEQPIKIEQEEKVSLFNNPNKLVSILSENGIGELKKWQNPFGEGWVSMSEDFEFGKKPNAHGFINSIGYLLEGSETQVKTISIDLYIYNASEKHLALTFLAQVTDKTLKSIGVTMPEKFKNLILSSEELNQDLNDYHISNVMEKGNIETWTLSIGRK
ncbi:MAG: hypothetical protein WAU24_04825 [Chitinophagaceae bacterium]